MGDVTARIERTIRRRIESGELGPGAQLPSERKLAHDLGAGRTTVRQVLAKLVVEGVLRVSQGRGYFVIGTEWPGGRPMEPWKIHGERPVYDNPWVRLDLVDVEPPGVERFEHHVVRLHRVAITAVLDDLDRVLMLWRYRFVPRKWGWELPGGIVDQDEDPQQTALREVEEETGWRPNSLEHVLSYEPMIGMVESPHELFVGRGGIQVGAPSDAEEAGEVSWIPLTDIRRLIKKDELLGSGTLIALLHILAFGR